MHIEVRSATFSPWQLLSEYEQAQTLSVGEYGATAVFVGSMRDFNEDVSVRSMFLEHYPEMTEKFLLELAQGAVAKWNLLDVLIVHRTEEVTPGDAIVMVAVWSAHRAHAYEANRHLMEALKSRAPFWKKETLDDGKVRWVEKNTPGTL
jgi:molybdopterin synthase catalytic subunit